MIISPSMTTTNKGLIYTPDRRNWPMMSIAMHLINMVYRFLQHFQQQSSPIKKCSTSWNTIFWVRCVNVEELFWLLLHRVKNCHRIGFKSIDISFGFEIATIEIWISMIMELYAVTKGNIKNVYESLICGSKEITWGGFRSQLTSRNKLYPNSSLSLYQTIYRW